MSITKLLELANQLPDGLSADWDGTNHYEMHARDEFWWLVLGDYPDIDNRSTGFSETEMGRRVGLILDIAAALKEAEAELREMMEKREDK